MMAAAAATAAMLPQSTGEKEPVLHSVGYKEYSEKQMVSLIAIVAGEAEWLLVCQ